MLERLERLSPRKLALLVLDLQAKLEAAQQTRPEPIAIVGLACRFPGGADTPERFWDLLRDGRDAIDDIPSDRWDVSTYFDEDPDAVGKMYVRHGGFLQEVDRFDAAFFGISPREAASMDPQHRLLLEVAWEALERAGHNPMALAGGRTGVFVGITQSDYMQVVGAAGAQYADAYLMTGNSLNFAAGRLAYALGLQGPCVALDTACSSSLTAIHLACRSLRAGDCDLALAGGVNLMLRPDGMIVASRARMLSPRGRCRTFDASADGIARAEGCGLLVLRPLSAALAAGDPIAAVIRGSAMNQDGRSSGITVPNGLAQEQLLRDALRDAGVEAADVGYVEAHGTGTPIGDPIEVRAIGAVFGERRDPQHPIMLGSVKTNIGHAESAAGVAGMIKVILALQHRQIPPHLHLEAINPAISLDRSRAAIPTAMTPWTDERRIAGVSAFGASGTNVHVLVESAPVEAAVSDAVDRPLHVLTLTARNDRALQALSSRYGQAIDASAPLADICFTANAGRAPMPHRRALVIDSHDAAVRALSAGQTAVADLSGVADSRPPVAFLFTGQGSQYVGMGRALYAAEPVFRAILDTCDAHLRDRLPHSLLAVLHGERADLLDDTVFTQPAIFALQYALCEMLRAWGIEPSATLGHSVGEYAAACAAGMMAFDDGLRLVAERARLMGALTASGRMAAVFADEATIAPVVAEFPAALSIAAYNAPGNIVLSGDEDALRAALERLAARGVRSHRLSVSRAFHSPLMDPMLDAFERFASTIPVRGAKIPWVSNLTGARVDGTFRLSGTYWRDHARRSVRFTDGIASLAGAGIQTFLEIGPQPTLLSLGKRTIADPAAAWLPTLRRGSDDWAALLPSIAALFVRGVDVNWNGFDAGRRRRKRILPTYPFERARYWITPSSAAPPPAPTYTVEWVEQPAASLAAGPPGGRWILVDALSPDAAPLAQKLGAQGARVDVVSADSVAGALSRETAGVIVMAGRDAEEPIPLEAERHRSGALLTVVQTLAASPRTLRLWVVTHGSQPVDGGVDPATAPVWGLAATIANEHPEWRPVAIDVERESSDRALDGILREIREDGRENRVAWRAGRRFVPRLTRSTLAPARQALRGDGWYLVTGGLGALGLDVARWLVGRGAGRVVLAGRRDPSAAAARALEELCGEANRVSAVRLDVADAAAVTAAIDAQERVDGPLRGIVHAAGVLDDGVLMQQDWTRFSRVLAPKMLGACHLADAARGKPLDFFVLFSSMAALLGAAGQGNYAAANAYLDAFAAARRAEGLRALSVSWGPWADGGMAHAVGAAHRARWAEQGIRVLSAPSALAALESAIGGPAAHMAVFEADWTRFARETEAPFLDRVRDASAQRDPIAAPRVLVSADGSAIRDAVAALCREAVAVPLGIAPAAIDGARPIAELGFDSLMAVEARNRLQRAAGISVPIVRLLDGSSLQALTDFVASQLEARSDRPRAAAPLSASEAATLLARLDMMGEAEIDGLLRRLQPLG